MKLVNKNSLIFLLAIGMSVFFMSCGSDDDNDKEEPKDSEKPEIELTSPEEGDEFSEGISILLKAKLTDNVELDTCYVSLSNSLKNGSKALKGTGDEPFEPNPKGYSLSGKQYIFEDEDPFGTIDVGSTPGEYTFSITVKDAAGNEASQDITINIIE